MTQAAHHHPARSLAWPALITASALAAVWAVLAGVGRPLQPVIVLWFLLVCPGMAIARLLRLGDQLAQWTLAITLSTALGVALAEVMVYSHRWSPAGAVVALAALSCTGAALDAVMTARRRPMRSGPAEDSAATRPPDPTSRL